MLDINGLPKNANGIRTTHTCELCGFEPKTKNKYREKQDHLVMKHFKDRIDKIFPHCRPYTCPNPDCDFTGKDKQALLRHYTGKHGVLELYLREALAEKGIQYNISDSAKRKSMSQSDRKAKEARLSPPMAPITATTQITNIQVSPVTNLNMAAPVATPLTTSTLTIPPAALTSGTTTLPTLATIAASNHMQQPPPTQQHQHHNPHHQQNHHQHQQTMMAADTTTPLGSDLSEIVYTSTVTRLPTVPTTRLPTVPTTKLPSMSTVLRPFTSHGKCDVDALLASFQPIDAQLVVSLPSPNDLPLDSPLVSSTTPDFFLPEEPNKLVLNDNIMWGGGNLPVVTEPAQTVPVNYLDAGTDLASLGDLDYDYLNPATIEPQSILAGSNAERQLSFSML